METIYFSSSHSVRVCAYCLVEDEIARYSEITLYCKRQIVLDGFYGETVNGAAEKSHSFEVTLTRRTICNDSSANCTFSIKSQLMNINQFEPFGCVFVNIRTHACKLHVLTHDASFFFKTEQSARNACLYSPTRYRVISSGASIGPQPWKNYSFLTLCHPFEKKCIVPPCTDQHFFGLKPPCARPNLPSRAT